MRLPVLKMSEFAKECDKSNSLPHCSRIDWHSDIVRRLVLEHLLVGFRLSRRAVQAEMAHRIVFYPPSVVGEKKE